MSNLIYNSDGINIVEPYKQNENKINDNIDYKYKINNKIEIIFDTSKENIIYNSDGFIHNYYYKEIKNINENENDNEYKIKIKSRNHDNTYLQIQENTSSKEIL